MALAFSVALCIVLRIFLAYGLGVLSPWFSGPHSHFGSHIQQRKSLTSWVQKQGEKGGALNTLQGHIHHDLMVS